MRLGCCGSSLIFPILLLFLRLASMLLLHLHLLLFEQFGLVLCFLVRFLLFGDCLLNCCKFLDLGLVTINTFLLCHIPLTDSISSLLKCIGQYDLKELWPDISFSLLHNVFVTQFCLDIVDTLHVGVGDLAIFITVTLLYFV